VNSFEELGGRLLVIFDGQCGFCNRSVRWFLRRDRRDRLRFVASDSPKVAELLARHGGSDPLVSG
jgi:predicted DCC family thiol-disulfide oxidoreductase YuxK